MLPERHKVLEVLKKGQFKFSPLLCCLEIEGIYHIDISGERSKRNVIN